MLGQSPSLPQRLKGFEGEEPLSPPAPSEATKHRSREKAACLPQKDIHRALCVNLRKAGTPWPAAHQLSGGGRSTPTLAHSPEARAEDRKWVSKLWGQGRCP